MIDAIHIWTVYDHPSDFPDVFVARLSVIGQENNGPTSITLEADTLDGVRDLIQARYPYVLSMVPRSPEDDPVIVECWL